MDFEIVGQTEDGKLVVKNVFSLYDTIGFPLEEIVYLLNNDNMLVDWVDFFESAMIAQWGITHTIKKIEAAVGDVFGPQCKNELIRRLKFCLVERENKHLSPSGQGL